MCLCVCVCVCVCVLCSSNVLHPYCAQELPEFWAVHLLLPTLVKRLTYASSVDLVPLLCVRACMHACVRVCVCKSTVKQLLFTMKSSVSGKERV